MREFVRHDGFLLFHGDPVEKIDGLGLGVVVASDFFAQERYEKGFEIELMRQQSELLQYKLGAAQALGIFVLEVIGQVGNDFIAVRQLTFYVVLNLQAGFLAVEGEDLVNGVKQLLGLARSDFDVAFGLVFRLVGGRDGLRRLLLLNTGLRGLI